MEEWGVKDLEDGSSLNISVLACSELGNQSKPGIQVCFMGNIVHYEPLAAERWAYQASKANVNDYLAYHANKAGVKEYLLEDNSWMTYDDQYVKNYLVTGSPLKAKVEVKTRSSKPVIKEYILPFEV